MRSVVVCSWIATVSSVVPACSTEPDAIDDGVAGSEGSGPTSASSGSDDGEDESGPGPVPDDCPVALFPSPSPDPANAAYPDPELEVECTATELVVRSNGIPAYEFQATTPNDLQAQDHQWRIPRFPVEAASPTSIPLLDAVGIAINGMPIFGPNEAAMPDPYGDPIYNGLMDFCLGHTAMGGLYHYHGLLVECLVGDVAAGEPSPIIGFAFDGHPIHGPVGCLDEACADPVTFVSGWQQTGDPSTYAWDNHAYVSSDDPLVLDECNGRVGPDGSYRYHATDAFPYVLGCYHGEATATGR